MKSRMTYGVIFFIAFFMPLLSIDGISYAMLTDQPQEQVMPSSPEYAPGEVLVKFKEGADPASVIQAVNIETKGIDRIHSIKPAVSKFKKDYKLEKTDDGWYSFLGKNYKEVADIPDEDIFEEAYSNMPETEKALYRTYKITLPEGMSVEEAVDRLKEDQGVEYAEPNYIVKVQMVPNDPYYHSIGSWGQKDDSGGFYDDLWGVKKIRCEQAWDITQGEGVVVAVIDSGVDYDHPDFFRDDNGNNILDSGDQYNIWINEDEIPANGVDDDKNGYIDDIHGYDFAYRDNNPMDGHGHGTHVAGTIAAVGNNGIGVIGVAPKAKVMVLKGLDDSGAGCTSDLVACIEYAANNGAKVLNNSWGTPVPSQALIDAFRDADAKGCVSVAAAGNYGAGVSNFSPANIDTIITVSALTQKDERCPFSNFGDKIDVGAPGGGYGNEAGNGASDAYNILSTMSDRSGIAVSDPAKTLNVGSGYWRLAGTSMACPHAAGAAALVFAKDPDVSNTDVRNAIRASSDDVGEEGKDIDSGYGRVNAYKAIIQEPVPVIRVLKVSPKYLPVSGNSQGERLSFAIEITNEWADAHGVTAELSIADDRIRVDRGVVTFGDVAYGEKKSNSEEPFVVTVLTRLTDPITDFPLILEFRTADGHRMVRNKNESISLVPDLAAAPFVSLEDKAHPFEEGRAIGDLDGDGTNELVIVASRRRIFHPDYFSIFVFNSDGTTRSGWPVDLNDGSGADTIGGIYPALCDIDMDGKKEIIISEYREGPDTLSVGEIRVYRNDGEILPGWPVTTDAGRIGDPVAGDIDKDGLSEIIAMTQASAAHENDGKCYVFRYDGSLKPGWPYVFNEHTRDLEDEPAWTPPVIGDVDGDGYDEVVAATAKGEIHIIGHGGRLKKVILVSGRFGDESMPSLMLGNLDSDPEPEIVYSRIFKIYAYNYDGTSVSGWPVRVGTYLNDWITTCAMGDIDGDKAPEIVASTTSVDAGTRIFAFKRNGSKVAGFPAPVNYPSGTIYNKDTVPILADVNADGSNDIIYPFGIIYRDEIPYPFEVRHITVFEAIDGKARRIDDFRKVFLHKSIYNTKDLYNGEYTINRFLFPSIKDFDNDGTLDLIVNFSGTVKDPFTGGFIYMVPIAGSRTSSCKKSWPEYQHDGRHTGCYNNAPVLHIENKVVDEGQLLEFPISATDIDDEESALRYPAPKKPELPKGADFNPRTKIFSWTPTYKQAGRHKATFTVTDGLSAVSKTIKITVNNVNRPPVLNPIGNKVVRKDKVLSFKVKAIDPDKDVLTYSVSGRPPGASFSAGGAFKWNPGCGQIGAYSVRFTASDGLAAVSETIRITVKDVR